MDKLSPTELQWYNDFIEEYLHAGFKSKRNKNNILKGKGEKKAAEDRNNARNRDLQHIIEMYPGLGSIDVSKFEDLDVITEDDIIELIDLLRELDRQGPSEG